MSKKVTSKRSKKFLASGGIATKLSMGTVTKKGKLLRKRKSPSAKNESTKPSSSNQQQQQQQQQLKDKVAKTSSELSEKHKQKLMENDFVTLPSNMSNMDMDDFFREATAVAANQNEKEIIADDSSGSEEDEDPEEEEEEEEDMDEDEISEEDSINSSDDEDIEEAEKRMKEEMSKLSQKDPEFHKFLKEHERSLLEFGEDEESEVEGEGEEFMEEDDVVSDSGEGIENDAEPSVVIDKATKESRTVKETEKQAEKLPSVGQILLTPKVLFSLEKHAFGPKHYGIKGLKSIISAYRTACHLSDSDQQSSKVEMDDDGVARTSGKYFIDSAIVFDRLMITCMNKCHEAFRFHLLSGDDAESSSDWDENKPIHAKKLMKAPRWKNVHSILKTFLRNTIHVLSEAKESGLVTFILKSLSNYVPFLTPFPRMAKGLLKTLTALWAAPLDDSIQQNYQSVRLHAFLRIRQLSFTQPFPFIEDCLKQTYLAYARTAKFTSETTLPTLTFMGNCLVELYSLDIDSSYQHAFVYIRQLALHLRSALQKKTKEAFQVVYCWQYLNCCKVWVAVLSANPGKDELYSLVYPLTEIIWGVAKLLPSTRYLPLRLHCVRMLQQLAASTETFIPTTAILLDSLELKEIYMKPKVNSKNAAKKKMASNAGVRLHLVWKLPKEETLRTMDQLDACLTEVFLLLNREVDLYRYSVGLPEFSVRICQRLRKFSKETKVGRWRAFSKGCIEICDRYSSFVINARSELVEAPKDIKRLEALKPQGAPGMRERLDAATAKERKLEVGLQPKTGKVSKEKEAIDVKVKASQYSKKMERAVKSKADKEDPYPTQNLSEIDEEDEVQEGVDWSEDEELGSGDESSTEENE
jgi:nucleolar complex protein 2